MHSSDKYLGIMSLHHFSRVPVPVRSPSFSHARLPNPARQMLLVRSNGTLLIVLGGGRLGSSVVLLLWWCVCVHACVLVLLHLRPWNVVVVTIVVVGKEDAEKVRRGCSATFR